MQPDGLTITGPTTWRPGEVNSRGDHRIAMSLFIAAALSGVYFCYGRRLRGCVVSRFSGNPDKYSGKGQVRGMRFLTAGESHGPCLVAIVEIPRWLPY